MSEALHRHIAALYEKVAELSGRLERMHRPGPVTDIDYSDATKPRVRIQIGTDDEGQPVKGPWVPVASHAGGRKIHAPVTVGQTMLMLSPDGNFENGVLIHYGFSQPNQSPSTDQNSHVDQFGDVTETLQQDSLKRVIKNVSVTHDQNGVHFSIDGVTFDFTSSGLAIQGGNVTHNGKHIDSTHIHGGVQPGFANTQAPSN